MKKRARNSRNIFFIFFAVLLIVISVFITYGLFKSSLSGNVVIRESSFFTSSADTVSGLVSEWRFNEAVWTGATGEVKDSIGNKDLTAFNGASMRGEGIDGKSAKFNGINNYIAGNYEMNFDSFSLSFWFNTLDAQSIRRIVEHGWSVDGDVSGVFTTHLDRGVLYTILTLGDGTRSFLASNELISTNKWYYYTLTYNGSSAKIYLDGSLKGYVNSNKPIRKVTKNLIIGGAPGVTFNGSIDQVMIYNKALSNEEITSLYVNQASNLAVPSSPEAILINSCQNITSSGKFELIKNLFNEEIFSTGCFIINGSNSELNCNGKSIVNTTINAPGIIVRNANNVSLRNCNIQMNDTNLESRGILVINSNNISLTNNVANKNYIGLELSGAKNNLLINNTINSNSLYGISFFKSDGNLILGNNFNSNSNGLLLSGKNNIIDLNSFISNKGMGIILNSADFNKFQSNNIYRNVLDGVLISMSANSTLTNNNVSLNGRNGVLINSSSNNIVDENSINYNSGYGISLFLESNYNNITRNKVGGNTLGTVYDDESNTNNVIEDNIEIFYPESCRNSVIDFNEEKTDCGGSCPVCQSNVKVIDNLDLGLGVSELMKKGDEIRFNFDFQNHYLELIELYDDGANFLFDLNSSFNLSLGERVKIDINEDMISDILLSLHSLNSSNAEVFLQLISEPILSEEPSNLEEPLEKLHQQGGTSEETENIASQTHESSSRQDKLDGKEKKSFFEENSFILLALGSIILIVIIMIVIWVKTPKAE